MKWFAQLLFAVERKKKDIKGIKCSERTGIKLIDVKLAHTAIKSLL